MGKPPTTIIFTDVSEPQTTPQRTRAGENWELLFPHQDGHFSIFFSSKGLPSGKQPHNYGKIHHFVAGKINDFYGHFQ